MPDHDAPSFKFRLGSRARERVKQAAEQAPLHPPKKPNVGDWFLEDGQVWLYTGERWQVVKSPTPGDWVTIKAQSWERQTRDMEQLSASLAKALTLGLGSKDRVEILPDLASQAHRGTVIPDDWARRVIEFAIYDERLVEETASVAAFTVWIKAVTTDLKSLLAATSTSSAWTSSQAQMGRRAARMVVVEHLETLGVLVDTEEMDLERETQEAIASIKRSLSPEQ